MKRILSAIAIIGVIAISASAQADIYKCQDPEGNVTYSDAPCASSPRSKSEVIQRENSFSKYKREPVKNRTANTEQMLRQIETMRALRGASRSTTSRRAYGSNNGQHSSGLERRVERLERKSKRNSRSGIWTKGSGGHMWGPNGQHCVNIYGNLHCD